MHKKKVILIEGIDRLGKSMLAASLEISLDRLGDVCTRVNHLGKPKVTKWEMHSFHPTFNVAEVKQKIMYSDFFENISSAVSPISYMDSVVIYDRAHLGEYVYSKRYRSYDGSYVFNLEKIENLDHVYLILLHTDDTSFLVDDGESFDFSQKDKEQEDFKKAFNLSSLKHKKMVQVNDGKSFRCPVEILHEVLDFINKGE